MQEYKNFLKFLYLDSHIRENENISWLRCKHRRVL